MAVQSKRQSLSNRKAGSGDLLADEVRAKLAVSPDILDADAEAAALADAGVRRALDGRSVAKVIVRAPKMVSIVPA